MEKDYTINEVATMTGLTTRTLRTYIQMGVLNGEKRGGVWRFSAEDVSALITNPYVRPSIQAKSKAVVFDFLADTEKKTNELCVILDLYAEKDEAEEISAFFCDGINRSEATGWQFRFDRSGKHVRVSLSGPEDAVAQLLSAYYHS